MSLFEIEQKVSIWFYNPGEDTFSMTLSILTVNVETHMTSTKKRNAANAFCFSQIDSTFGYLEYSSMEQTHLPSYKVLNDKDKFALEKMINNKSNKINLILASGFLIPNGLALNSSQVI